MKSSEKYKIAFKEALINNNTIYLSIIYYISYTKHVIGDLSKNITKKKQFHQLISICGQNLSNKQVHAAWIAISDQKQNGVEYCDFCAYCDSLPKSDAAEQIKKFFGEEIERKDLKIILAKSDAELRTGQILSVR